MFIEQSPALELERRPPSRVGELAAPVHPLPFGASCAQARATFHANQNLSAVAVIDEGGHPVGLINRFKFLERLASPFGRDVLLNRAVGTIADANVLVVDESTHIDELGPLLLSQPSRDVLDGFIVTSVGRYVGIGTGLDVIRALTERRHAELRQMAFHDMQTGLANRALFEERLTQALAVAPGSSMAVLFVDLDRFKEINDSYGHRIGDHVISAIAERLRSSVRRGSVVARLSGDEFAILVPDARGAEDADAMARLLLSTCSAPVVVDGRDIVVSCSIGVALYPEHGTTRDALLRAADTAQYHAKEVRNSWQRYTTEMTEWRPATPGLSALRHAMDSRQLVVHYQPVVELESGRIVSIEALVRWTHDGVAIPPGSIVNLAEQSGLIVPLADYVMRTAVADLTRLDAEVGGTGLRLSVNISPVQIGEGSLVTATDRVLSESGFDATRLDFELTERAAMRGSAADRSTLAALRERGITLTIDDFGTGYSALSRLEGLPIHGLKIDKSFLERIHSGRSNVVARAIIAMGRALGLRVIAEGVETAEQLAFVRREGCDCAQGYLLGRPCDVSMLRDQLNRDRAARRRRA
jgi:diguanylate cyclase (GGDEF)-like protein